VRVYHGTSERVLDQIRIGSERLLPVYTESNVALGGTYLAAEWGLARVAAFGAARAHTSAPVLLTLEIDPAELLPDEDWVVNAAEAPEGVHYSRRIARFLEALFLGYLGEGWSLSDHYRERYDALNAEHRISWRDSWHWCRCARIARSLRSTDIVAREALPRG
jgi:hypothetical protein